MQFALTIFISAFLLFQVQPLIARYILPWFGGSPAVWSTCMLFFQVGLLVGYSYAHVISKYLSTKKQVIVHFALLGLSLLLMPITPSEIFKPDDASSPVFDIILLLLSTVGFPYMLVSSTGPLLQQWFGKKFPNKSPWRLYALSNLGSLLGLLTYPFIVEPNMGLEAQTISWSIGYGVFILVCGWAGYLIYQSIEDIEKVKVSEDTPEEGELKMSKLDPLLWVALSACGSVLLLAATNFICQDVAVIPFLWILPLSLYLITFIIAFDSPRWYVRWIWIPALLLILPRLFSLLEGHYTKNSGELFDQIFTFAGGMFIAVMICHGEMVRLKPPRKNLTFFYLVVSLGGALGGVFVTLIAPEIFIDFWEWPLSFVFVLLLAGLSFLRRPGFNLPQFIESKLPENKLPQWALPTIVGVIMGTGAVYFGSQIPGFQANFKEGVLGNNRNFYGVSRVIESGQGTKLHRRKIYNGQINHGLQLLDPKFKNQPSSYYARHSGVGIAIRKYPLRLQDKGIKMGVVGLGAGSIGIYHKPEDEFIFYELDPDVEKLARTHFTYLSDAGEGAKVVLGDARISMEREFKEKGSHNYDIIAVDAFSGDAIPIHLLTTEAFELYYKHLKPEGILAIHISNLYFDLKPLTYSMAKKFNKTPFVIKKRKDADRAIKGSTWVLITTNQEFIKNPRVTKYLSDWPSDIEENKVIWTDNYSNIVGLLKD